MEGDKIKTNILIAGKSGVGKSSLLNYIFGEEVAETGAGKPDLPAISILVFILSPSIIFLLLFSYP